MDRTITEVHEFSREQVEEVIKQVARAKIVGSIYHGSFGEQSVEWREDGSARVTTVHAPEEPTWRERQREPIEARMARWRAGARVRP